MSLRRRIDEARLALMILTVLPLGRLADPVPPIHAARWAMPFAGLPLGLAGWSVLTMGAAIGLQGRSLRRNSPSNYNVGYQRSLFHEGRELHLEDQIWGPLLSKNEMDMPSVGYVVGYIDK